MRAFTMQRQRSGVSGASMTMYFGARTSKSLPYFGPLKKVPHSLLEQNLVFSREGEKEYVQDRMLKDSGKIAELLTDAACHIYICGLKDMEAGVEAAFTEIAREIGQDWANLRDQMREDGRYHVETY
jgi:benzoyl-CoA 2,3-dioxygenase component A